jgi:transcriptional regulator
MHPNPIFRETSQNAAVTFARSRGFGILSINGSKLPLTAHIPFVLQSDGESVVGHLVASNPIWRAISQASCPALLSVSGPDGYISPDWYGVPDQVPTWNYVAVNLSGTLSALPQSNLREILDVQSEMFEARLPNKVPWRTDKMPDDIMDRMMRQIRPFKLTIEKVDSTWKLSQNKTAAARQSAGAHVSGTDMGLETGLLGALMCQVE